jgi:hypothetical protein
MKRVYMGLFCFALVIPAGCTTGSATAPSTNPAEPDKPRKLTVNSPGEQAVKQNGTNELEVSIKRDNFEGPIKVELRDLPSGVEIVKQDMTIPAGKNSLKVTVRAKPEANVIEDHTVTVAAIPNEKDMKEALVSFKLDVKPRE